MHFFLISDRNLERMVIKFELSKYLKICDIDLFSTFVKFDGPQSIIDWKRPLVKLNTIGPMHIFLCFCSNKFNTLMGGYI